MSWVPGGGDGANERTTTRVREGLSGVRAGGEIAGQNRRSPACHYMVVVE